MSALALALVRRDGGTQPRDRVNMDVAREYAEAIVDGAKMPPITVFYDGTDYWLADGFHRWHAHEILRETGLLASPEIAADIISGTKRDAVLHSAGVNATHGYPRTIADKRRAVRTLLADPDWAAWSDREIARRCHVSPTMVAPLRPTAVTANSCSEAERTYRNRYGNEASMKVAAIGAAPSRPLPTVAGRTPDRRPQPACEKSEHTGIGGASMMTGIRADKLAAIARTGEIDGAEKNGTSWYFETDKLRAWMKSDSGTTAPHDEGGDVETDNVVELAGEPLKYDPVLDPTTGGSLLLAMCDVFDQVAKWPDPNVCLSLWRDDLGAGINPATVASVAEWIRAFAADYPEIDDARQSSIQAAFGRSNAHVA